VILTTQQRLIEIARRKERLSARAQAQRASIAGQVGALQGPIRFADRAVEIARFLRAHPAAVAVAAAALVALRGRGLTGLAGRALTAWRLWRTVSAWAARAL
jgi:hypothetical protein